MARVASPRSTPLVCALLGRTKDALLGHTLADYAAASPTSRHHASQLTSAAHNRRSAELQVLRPDGSEVWLGVVTTLVHEVSGENYWFEQLRDVTDRKQAERALQELAMFDPLTGLPNQNLLKDRVAQAMNRAGQAGSGVAVVLIGIDRFRVVTDSLGHPAGESLLAPSSQRSCRMLSRTGRSPASAVTCSPYSSRGPERSPVRSSGHNASSARRASIGSRSKARSCT